MKASDPDPEPIPCNGLPPRGSSVSATAPCGFEVIEEDYDEHHMSAYELHFITSTPIEGVSRFRTTNGRCRYERSTDKIEIRDQCMMLEIDPHTLACRHRHFDRDSNPGPWHEGMGRASTGQFPSAHEPHIKRPPNRVWESE